MKEDKQQPSRRELFRLKPAKKEPLLGQPNPNGTSSELKAIEHPVNHDGMDMSQLPPMVEATLTSDQVNLLFSDIAQLAANIQLMQRKSSASVKGQALVLDSKQQLKIAGQRFLSGQISRLQIRYDWEATQWIDTLELKNDAVRLIRIRHQPPMSS